MPTYSVFCDTCDDLEYLWASIHDGAPRTGTCGHPVVNVIHPPAIHGLNSKVVTIDQREKRWDRDLPAYKRLRDDGLEPPGIDGAGNLEQRADDEWFVKTGGQFGVPEDRKDEINEMLADGQVNSDNWSPVEQVREERKKARA